MSFDVSEWAVHASALASSTRGMEAKISTVVRKSATDLQAEAKRLSPVDTGNLRSRISTRQITPTEALVISGANYAIFQEYGTRYQPGTPHMKPAADKIQPAFEQAVIDAAAGGAI